MIEEYNGRFIVDRVELEALANISEDWALANWDNLKIEPLKVMDVAVSVYMKLGDGVAVARCMRESGEIERKRADLRQKAERKSRSWFSPY
ncbi:MAG: hypothetical protein JWP57_4679 [Spirosoma sp.]|nr:hypothetical protein [Spirosoma sp.]